MQYEFNVFFVIKVEPSHWRHNDHDGVSNHQPHGCLLNRLFRRRSKKTSKLRVTGLCVGDSPGPVNSPHKRPVTRKKFPFDDVIMYILDEIHVDSFIFKIIHSFWRHRYRETTSPPVHDQYKHQRTREKCGRTSKTSLYNHVWYYK